MGSNYFGDLSLGNERSSPTNSSSRKGRKSSSSDKPPKQPQRGLGVAQLEQIRLHSQIGDSTYLLPPSNHYFASPPNVSQEVSRWRTPYSSSPSLFSCSSSSSSSSSFGFPVQQQSFMMGLNEMGNIKFPDSVHQRTPTSRWNHGNAMLEGQYLKQPSNTSHFLNQQEEDLLEGRRMKDKIDTLGSSIHNYESSEDQELDLELRLAL